MLETCMAESHYKSFEALFVHVSHEFEFLEHQQPQLLQTWVGLADWLLY